MRSGPFFSLEKQRLRRQTIGWSLSRIGHDMTRELSDHPVCGGWVTFYLHPVKDKKFNKKLVKNEVFKSEVS